MAVSTTTTFQEHVGNASTVNPYAINFRFDDTDHIQVARLDWEEIGEVTEVYIGTRTFVVEGVASVSVGDKIRDDASREGTVETVTIVGGNTEIRYEDGSTFSVTESDTPDVKTATVLDQSAFTVTRLADGSAGSVVTDVAIAATSTVRIFRQVPLTQPTEFPLAGPFPSSSAEQMGDRLLMQIQELAARVATLEGGENPHGIVVPSGDSASVLGVKKWANAAARATTSADFAGQLGIETGTRTLWVASSTTAGAWTEQRERVVVSFILCAYNVEIGNVESRWFGNMPVDGIVDTIIVGTAEIGTVSTDYIFTTGGDTSDTIGTGTMPDDELAIEIDATFASEIPAGTPLLVSTSSSYGTPDHNGLSITFIITRS